MEGFGISREMEVETIWYALCQFPIELFELVLANLGVDDLVMFDVAARHTAGKSVLQNALALLRPIDMKTLQKGNAYTENGLWLLSNQVRVFNWHVGEAEGILADLIKYNALLGDIHLAAAFEEIVEYAGSCIANKVTSLELLLQDEEKELAPSAFKRSRTLQVHSNNSKAVTGVWIADFIRYHPELAELHLDYLPKFSKRFPSVIGTTVSLQTLSLKMQDSSAPARRKLRTFAQHCHRVRCLTIEVDNGCRSFFAEIEQYALDCPLLEKLYIEGCDVTTPGLLTQFVQRCPLLRVLHCNVIISGEVLRAMAEAKPPLEELCVSHWFVSSVDAALSCAGVFARLLHFQCNVALQKCTQLSLAAALRSMSGLRQLYLWGLTIGQEVWDAASDTFTELRQVTLQAIDTTALVQLVTRNPRLEKLAVYRIGAIDPVLVALGAHCPLLQEVTLTSSEPAREGALVALAEGCRRLQRVDIAGPMQLTERSIRSLIEHCHRLKKIS